MESRFSSLLARTQAEYAAQPNGIATGYPTLDAALKGGLRPGQMALLLARPEVGKTVVAVNMAVTAAQAGYGVAIASLEMTAPELTVRALSVLTGASDLDVVEAVKSKEPQQLVLAGVQQLKDLHIRDKPKPQWDDLAKWLAEIKGRTGKGTDFMVLDHLRLMARYGYPRGNVERVEMLAADSKVFAKEHNLALVVVHHVGRAVEGAENGQKNHGHIPLSMEESLYGGEDSADVVLTCWRPERDPTLTPQARLKVRDQLYVGIAKNRNGPGLPEGVKLKWCKPSLRIVEENGNDDIRQTH